MAKLSRKQKIKELIGNILISDLMTNRSKIRVLKKLGVKFNGSAMVKKFNHIDGFNLEIGNGSLINRGAFIYQNGLPEARIKLGDNVFLAPNISLICVSHKIGDSKMRAGDTFAGLIEIKDGSWLGEGVKVMPGVTIEKGCVIASGSIVTKDTEPNGLYAGVPARRIKDLE